jgi:hypothetical protein
MSQNLAELIFQFCVAFFLFQERRKEKKKGRGDGGWGNGLSADRLTPIAGPSAQISRAVMGQQLNILCILS